VSLGVTGQYRHNLTTVVNIDLSHDLPSRLVRLVGRELEIEILHAHLGDPADGQRVVLLSGLGGIGKTQLALHYLERYNTVYQAVFWVRSSSEKDIVLSFRDIGRNLTHAVCAVSPATTEAEAARAIGLPRADSSFSGQNLGYFDITTDDLIQAVKRYLSRRQNERWILVFDGWDSSDMIDIKTCFPSAKHGHILITTQQRDSVPWAISLELSGLNVQMGLKLLFHRLPEKFDQPLGG
jgi:hypothetical protein